GFVAVWLVAPWSKVRSSSAQVAPAPASVTITRTGGQVGTIQDIPSLRQLADAGDPIAQFGMGAKYATGDGVKQDDVEAVRWFTKAAEQGHVVAQATLGACYWAGRGVRQDLSKAYFWSILAQAGGNELSKYRVQALTARMNRSDIVAAERLANEWIKTHQLG